MIPGAGGCKGGNRVLEAGVKLLPAPQFTKGQNAGRVGKREYYEIRILSYWTVLIMGGGQYHIYTMRQSQGCSSYRHSISFLALYKPVEVGGFVGPAGPLLICSLKDAQAEYPSLKAGPI